MPSQKDNDLNDCPLAVFSLKCRPPLYVSLREMMLQGQISNLLLGRL